MVFGAVAGTEPLDDKMSANNTDKKHSSSKQNLVDSKKSIEDDSKGSKKR